MGDRIDKLLSLAGTPVSSAPVKVPQNAAGGLAEELAGILARVNGFYAFESALHVRASGPTEDEQSLEEWNADDLWRSGYGAMADGHLFFAEDVFGGQFSIKDDHVQTFDPETGDARLFSSDLEQWAEQVLLDFEVLTGFPLAHEWQQRFGPLPPGARLVPKRPFVLGGEFAVENLYVMDAAESMRYRAEIARQIKHLPDGSSVTFKLAE